jgi:hypothetical protein
MGIENYTLSNEHFPFKQGEIQNFKPSGALIFPASQKSMLKNRFSLQS